MNPIINQIEVDGILYDIVSTVLQSTGVDTTRAMSQKAVSDILAQIYHAGKNKYNKDARIDGSTVDVNGNQVTYSGYSVSDYIRVETNKTYTFSHDGYAENGWITRACFYDDNQTFVSVIASPKIFTVPEGATYLRFATSTVRMGGNLQLEENSYATAYESFEMVLANQSEVEALAAGKFDKINVVQTTGNSASLVMSQKVVSELFAAIQTTLGQIYRAGKNRYNKDARTDEYTLNIRGATVASSGRSTSDYIEVDPGTAYIFSLNNASVPGGITIICFYDKTKTFLSYVEAASNITIPTNATYLRFATSTERMSGNMQLEKGSTFTEYAPYSEALANQSEVDRNSKKINELVPEVDRLVQRTTESYVAYVSGGTFVSKVDGNLYAGSAYGSTSYIAVPGGEAIKIKGFSSASNASTCTYDENFNFLGAIITDAVDDGSGKIITLGDNVAYIRVTSTSAGSVSVEFVDKAVAEKTVENIPYDLGTLTSDQYISKLNGAAAGGTTMYAITGFIEVSVPSIRIENPYLTGNAGICEYDANYNFISCLLSDISKGQYTANLSVNAKYIRVTTRKNNTNYLQIFPIDDNNTDTGSSSNEVVDSWMIATSNQIKTPYAKIGKLGPTITFIDDDTASYNAVKRYHDVFTPFAAQGARGCYAVVTDYMAYELTDDGVFVRDENGNVIPTSTSKLKDTLLNYEDEGFGMLFHAKWQDTYYMEGANRDLVRAEADYCKGMRKMREIGFIDYNYWVSPYGVMDAEIASMCKRHGAKCLMSTYNNTYIQLSGLNGKNESVDRYAMPRCSFGSNADQYPAFTLEKLKAQIDACVLNSGWIIITSHAAQWGEAYDDTQSPDEALASIVQYALDAGCTVKTFAEAYAERNSVLMINDIC